MSLIRWMPNTDLLDPFSSLEEIRDEVNHLFNSSLRRVGSPGLQAAFLPALDVAEEKDKFLIRCDLPGLRREDVSVTLQDNYLTIKGERKHEAETRETSYYRRERVSGTFTRMIEMPMSVDAKKIDAHFRDGVLHVTLPKSEEAKPKQIEIKVD